MGPSLRFFEDVKVRGIWNEEDSKWWFYAVDIVEALTKCEKPRVRWGQLKRTVPAITHHCKPIKIKENGKTLTTELINPSGVNGLMVLLATPYREDFVYWFSNIDRSLSELSKQQAYELFESGAVWNYEVGTAAGLKLIHAYLFGGLLDDAGEIRTEDLVKGGYLFAMHENLKKLLIQNDKMPERTFEEIAAKYVRMNLIHPFKQGNGRSMRIWLDLMLKKNLGQCVDWSRVDKRAYLAAMKKSSSDPEDAYALLKEALTDKFEDPEFFLRGIDYSYYFDER